MRVGREPKYTVDDILDAAARLVAEGRPAAASVVAIAAAVGAPSGSIYHRFASRDLILARLWIRTIHRFQAGALEAIAHPDVETAQRGAIRHVLDWSAANPDDARILTMYRRDELLAAWPDELGPELRDLNSAIEAAVGDFTMRRFGRVDSETLGRTRMALIEIPYLAVRRVIARNSPAPEWMASAVLAASDAVLTKEKKP